MVAITHLPGDPDFAYYHGTRAECEAWIERRKRELQYTFFSNLIITDRAARKWRWGSGEKIFDL